MSIKPVQASLVPVFRSCDSGYLAGFSLYLACLVLFRVLFASVYIIKWKLRYNCLSSYKVTRRNLMLDFKNLKKNAENGESTDDEVIEEELNKIYEKNRGQISRHIDTESNAAVSRIIRSSLSASSC